ncbi:MAG TPA: hypothetical protein VK402_03985 [Blastococcus sp.]|nr:hypothetical protein [Blastococcus sp.]
MSQGNQVQFTTDRLAEHLLQVDVRDRLPSDVGDLRRQPHLGRERTQVEAERRRGSSGSGTYQRGGGANLAPLLPVVDLGLPDREARHGARRLKHPESDLSSGRDVTGERDDPWQRDRDRTDGLSGAPLDQDREDQEQK